MRSIDLDSPEQLRAVLLNAGQISRRPGISLVDQLVKMVEDNEEIAEVLGRNLAELLKSREALLDDTGEAWQMALELGQRANLKEIIKPLRKLVLSRSLAAPVGDYSDLHGRALEVLSAIDEGFDPMKCWSAEKVYRDYAPLAFSFVRDKSRSDVPAILPEVARLGFLKEAIRTILSRYPEEGFELIAAGAQIVRNRGDVAGIGAFLDSILRLNVNPAQEQRIRSILGFGSLPTPIFVELSDGLSDLVVDQLRGAGVAAAVFSPGLIHLSPECWFLVSGMNSSRSFPGWREARARGRVIEVFREGDLSPSASVGDMIIVPSFVEGEEDIAKIICDRALVILRSERFAHAAGPMASVQAKSPPSPDRATMDALEVFDLVSK